MDEKLEDFSSNTLVAVGRNVFFWYMVDNSDLVLAFWNGKESGGTYYTLSYAKKKDKHVFCCMLNDIKNT